MHGQVQVVITQYYGFGNSSTACAAPPSGQLLSSGILPAVDDSKLCFLFCTEKGARSNTKVTFITRPDRAQAASRAGPAASQDARLRTFPRGCARPAPVNLHLLWTSTLWSSTAPWGDLPLKPWALLARHIWRTAPLLL